jgi:hypothetical protein
MRLVPGTRPGVAGVFCALLLFALTAGGPARAAFEPSHRWSTAETAHFVVHFHEGCDEIAARAGQVAEEVHARLAPRMGWAPREKTRLVLVDDEDAANGFASPYPYNQIVLFLEQPFEEPGFGTVVHDDWLRLVITHEYTHVLQLDMVAGLPRLLQAVFGRLYFPNALQPEWLVEGLATYEETELTAGGRGRSPGADMVLRMAVLEDRFPTPDLMGVFPDAWPAGQVPYLFGESFVRFIAERHGRAKLAEVSRAYSGRTLPFLVDATGRRVLGEGYRTLWLAWAASLRERYRRQAGDLEAEGLTASRPLTDGGYLSLAPAWSPDGTRIAWLQADAHAYPGVWVMNADGSGKRRIARGVFSSGPSGASLAWSPDGMRLYYTKLDVWRGYSVFNDLYAFDFPRGTEVRLTRGLRARDPHPSPDGGTILFVTSGGGRSRLATLAADAPLPATARSPGLRHLTAPAAVQYANPRWSPDGARIAVSVWQPGGDKDIWLLDPEGRKTAEIFRDRALDGTPAWSPDGRLLYFTSDRSGVFNLYAWEAATGAVGRITNVLGGAFAPAPSPDGRSLAFSRYGAGGYDIHVLELDALPRRPAGAWRDPYPPPPAPATPVPLAARPYSPLSTLAPRLWSPWAGYSAESGWLAGFTTGGQDAVQRHTYFLTGLYGPADSRVVYAFDYFYSGFRPVVHLGAADQDVTFAGFFDDGRRAADYTERDRALGVDVTYPLLSFSAQHHLTLGYRFRQLSALSDAPPWTGYGGAAPLEGDLGSARLSWQFNGAHRYPYSISPEDGRSVELGVERFAAALGSDAAFTRATGDWIEYLPLPGRHHVLQGRVFLGLSSGEPPAQGAYQLGGDTPGDLTYTIEDRAVHLRGYPPGAFRGDQAAFASLEYRFPVLNVERGPGSAPLFLRRLHGALFCEAGEAWDDSFAAGSLKKSVGGEARLDLTFSYFLPVTLRVGVAVGLDDEGEVVPTLGLWMPFGLTGAGSLPRQAGAVTFRN